MDEEEPETRQGRDEGVLLVETPKPKNITNGEHKELWDAIWEGRVKLAQVATEVRIGVGLAAAILGAVIFQVIRSL